MSDGQRDVVDRRILHLLQEDARNNTNAAISERVSVSPSTVGNRIERLEESGVIEGYRPDIDYDAAGFPLRVLFVCTAPIADRRPLVKDVVALSGVVNVTELMTGENNVHIEVVGSDNEDITRLATAIDRLGITVTDEVLVKSEFPMPANVFDPDATDRR